MAFSFVRLLAVSLLAIPAIVSAAPSTTTPATFNPTGIKLNPLAYIVNVPRPVSQAVPETNAQRLKRGFGPKPPVRRSHRALYPRQSSTPPPPPTPPPPAPVFPTGAVTVTYTNNGAITTGFISAIPNPFGEYGFTTDPTQALQVELHNTDANTSFDIKTLNGIPRYPYFGLIEGFANTSPNLSPTSYNYFYIGGTTQTSPNSPPFLGQNAYSDAAGTPEHIESAVWRLSEDGTLAPQWVNTDGSAPAGTLVYVPGSGAFAITGNVNQFKSSFGDAYIATFSFSSA